MAYMQINTNKLQSYLREYKLIPDTNEYASIDQSKDKILSTLQSQIDYLNITFKKKMMKRKKMSIT